MNLLRGPGWEQPLRAGHPAQRRDLVFLGCWALLLVGLLVAERLVDLPALLPELAALATALQALGIVVGLLLRNPRPEDYHDHKYLG